MKKFIACLLAFSLLFSVSASAAGVDAYTVDEDVTVFSMLAANASDYAVMPLAVSSHDTELEALNSIDGMLDDEIIPILETLRTNSNNISNLLDITFKSYLSSIETKVVSLESMYSSYKRYVDNTFKSQFEKIYDYFDSSNLVTIYDDFDSVVEAISSLDSEDSVLNQSLDTLFNNASNLTYLNASGIVMAMPSKSSITTILRNGFAGLGNILKIPDGSSFLSTNGFITTSSSAINIGNLLRNGLIGLQAQIKAPSGADFLNSRGQASTTSQEVTLSYILRYGLLGIRSLLSGTQTDNEYSVYLRDNSNAVSSQKVSGIGPLMDRYLWSIQDKLGYLSYMYASPVDLEAKQDSESTTQAVTDSFLDPDSDASVKLSDVGTLKYASAQVQQLGQTGVTPGQAFEQLGNADLFAFFTEEAANDLDSRVSTYSRNASDRIVTNYYEQSRTEFFDLIGREE